MPDDANVFFGKVMQAYAKEHKLKAWWGGCDDMPTMYRKC